MDFKKIGRRTKWKILQFSHRLIDHRRFVKGRPEGHFNWSARNNSCRIWRLKMDGGSDTKQIAAIHVWYNTRFRKFKKKLPSGPNYSLLALCKCIPKQFDNISSFAFNVPKIIRFHAILKWFFSTAKLNFSRSDFKIIIIFIYIFNNLVSKVLN